MFRCCYKHSSALLALLGGICPSSLIILLSASLLPDFHLVKDNFTDHINTNINILLSLMSLLII